jgi:two-component system response regulator RegA
VHSFLLGGRAASDRTFKVLVVDSDPNVVRNLGTALRNEGCQTLEATSFEAGKQLWIAEQPPVLIADVRLGQFNGLQLLLRAKADRPDVRAVITCAFPDKVLEAETVRFGGTFMAQPFNIAQVIAVALASRQPAQPEPFVERRVSDRRQNLITDIDPERRSTSRRRL